MQLSWLFDDRLGGCQLIAQRAGAGDVSLWEVHLPIGVWNRVNSFKMPCAAGDRRAE